MKRAWVLAAMAVVLAIPASAQVVESGPLPAGWWKTLLHLGSDVNNHYLASTQESDRDLDFLSGYGGQANQQPYPELVYNLAAATTGDKNLTWTALYNSASDGRWMTSPDKSNYVKYWHIYIIVPGTEDRLVRFHYRHDDDIRMWNNGTLALSRNGWDNGNVLTYDGTLHAGVNAITIKLREGGGGDHMAIKVTDRNNVDYSDLSYALSPGSFLLAATPASAIGEDRATLNGEIAVMTGDPFTVWALWSTNDWGEVLADWQALGEMASLGQPVSGALAHDVSALAPSTFYYYRFFATNDTDSAWSAPAVVFKTLGGAPVIDNGVAPVVTTFTEATVPGNLSFTPSADVTLLLGTEVGVWSREVPFGAVSEGAFSRTVSGLDHTTIYRYTWVAENAYGVSTAAVARSFATLGTCYVATNGTHVAPFRTPATAATNFTAAVVMATSMGSGSVVQVYPGTFPVDAQVMVTNGLTIRAADPALPRPVIRRRVVGNASPAHRVFYMTHAQASISGLAITGGWYSRGCGVWMNAGTVSNCFIYGNSSRDNYGERTLGAGVYMEGGLLTHSTISTNSLYGEHGGGAALYMKNAARTLLCRIEGNSNYVNDQSEGGGALSLRDSAVLEGCLVLNNANTSGTSSRGNSRAAVFMEGSSSARVRNCTIVGNANASGSVAGLAMNNGKTENTIVWGNYTTAAGYSSAQVGNGDGSTYDFRANSSYSVAPELTSGTANQIGDPLLAADFKLRASSPGRDSGTGASLIVAKDLAGVPRVLNGTVDRGCFEFDPQAGVFVADFAPNVSSGFGSLNVTFTAAFAGSSPNPASIEWDFGAGWVVGSAVASHTFGLGKHTVALRASNTDDPPEQAAVSYTDLITVYAYTNYVDKYGSHEYPFDTWARAATNVQTAVDAAGVGAVVMVGPGTHDVAAQVTLGKRLTLVSRDGRDLTTLRRLPSATKYRVLYVPAANVIIDGFTITGGDANYGGGVYMVANSVIRNCLITLNKGTTDWSRGAGLCLEPGTAERCIVRDNGIIQTHGTGAGIALNNGAKAYECLVEKNWMSLSQNGNGCGVYVTGGSTIQNSVIRHNAMLTAANSQASMAGLNLENGTAINCTVVGNTNHNNVVAGVNVSSSGTLRNSIVWANVTRRVEAPVQVSSAARCWNSCAPELTAGVNANINGNPLLKGDQTLQAGSPCLNTGDNSAMTRPLDLAGQPRIVATTVDMGAYEWPLPGGTLFMVR